MAHFVVISHLSPATPLIAQRAHEQSVPGSRMECVHGHSNMNNHSPRLTGFSHCWVPNPTAAKPSTQYPVWHCCLGWPTSYFDVRMIALYGFHHGRGSVLFLMEWILTLDMDLLSIPAMLLQKTPFAILQNVLFTVRTPSTHCLFPSRTLFTAKEVRQCSWSSLVLPFSLYPEQLTCRSLFFFF